MGRAIDLNSVKTFLRIVETGSFTRAAHLVGRSQSAVSMQIKRLEGTLGGSLFQRDGKTLTLSERGNHFLPLAQRLIAEQETIIDQIRSMNLSGRVRLGICDDFAEGLLAGVLQRFRQMHSQVDLEITIDLSVPLLDRFDAGELDMVVAKRLPVGPERTFAILTRSDLVWVSARGFKLKTNVPLPLVLFPERAFPRDIIIAALKRAGLQWTLAATCHSLAALRAAVGAGIGITAIAANAAWGYLEQIQSYELPKLPCAETALFWKPGALTPAINRLRGILINATLESARSCRVRYLQAAE